MTLNPVFVEGPRKEVYYLGRIKRYEERAALASTKRRIPSHNVTARYRRIIPVFVTYDFESKQENLSAKPYFRGGKIVLPRSIIVEGFSFNESYLNLDQRYSDIEKRTFPDGRIIRVKNNVDADGFIPFNLDELLKSWEPEILDLIKELPAHVLNVIGL